MLYTLETYNFISQLNLVKLEKNASKIKLTYLRVFQS